MNEKIHILLSDVYCVWQVVKTQTFILNNPVQDISKDIQYSLSIRTAMETITADMLQTVWNELDYLVDVCRVTNGAHIERL